MNRFLTVSFSTWRGYFCAVRRLSNAAVLAVVAVVAVVVVVAVAVVLAVAVAASK